ncbi:MAG: tetratricopeptide repeat protein, partial [Gemmataceae bacterium]
MKEADDVMDRLVSQIPEDYQAHLSRWRYRRDFGLIQIGETANQGDLQLEEAGKDIQSALSRKPDSVEVLLAAADLERIRARVVADDTGKSVQKRQKEIQNHRQVALDYLRKAEELVKPEPTTSGEHKLFQILWHKGNLLLDEMDLQYVFADTNTTPGAEENPATEQVRQIISRVRKLQMVSAADYMEGRWLIHEGKWGDAASKFERARAQLSGQRDLACQVDLYLGMCYERLQEPAQMFNSYKRVLEFDAESVPALLGMASARWAQGQLDNALSQYQLLMKQNKVPTRAWTDIARL